MFRSCTRLSESLPLPAPAQESSSDDDADAVLAVVLAWFLLCGVGGSRPKERLFPVGLAHDCSWPVGDKLSGVFKCGLSHFKGWVT